MGNNLKEFIKYMGNQKGTKKWQQYQKLLKETGKKKLSYKEKVFLLYDKKQAEKIYSNYDKKQYKLRKTKSLDNINDTLKQYIYYFGQQQGNKKWKKYQQKTKQYGKEKIPLKQRWLILYPKNIAKKKYQQYLDSIDQSLNGFIRRYGKLQGEKRFVIFRQKSKQNKSNFIKRYGEIQGIKKYNQMTEKRKLKNKRCIQYWLNKFDGDFQKAKKHQGQFQSRGKQFYIKKYGQQIGVINFNKMCTDRSKALKYHYKHNPQTNKKISKTLLAINKKLTKQQRKDKHSIKRKYIKKHGQQYGLQKFYEIYQNRKSNFYSNISIKFIQQLLQQFDEGYFDQVKYKNKQFFLRKNNKEIYFYDLYLRKNDKKIIIQFHGDFWHANPEIYKEHYFHPIIKKTAKDIWKKDIIKQQLVLKNNIKYYVVWQNEYNKNGKFIIDKTKEKIMGEINGASGN